MKYQAVIDDQKFEVQIIDEHTLTVNGEESSINFRQGQKPEHFSLILDGQSHQVWIEECQPCRDGKPSIVRIHLHGFDYEVQVDTERSLKLREFVGTSSSSEVAGQINAPMPGLVVKVLVENGQEVKKGDGVIIVEAMKMENEIKSPIDGIVSEIHVQNRQAVEKGETLIIIG
ncbi:biotin/lipoyl-binding protein [bacterium]|nr:biotin/lipoyl-binding protein [bacterium]MBU1651962.1 biotin/lipoyl-binding protein [bacterium]MBU1881151.1 biotin/lipoyl-binding protein [bacterium]